MSLDPQLLVGFRQHFGADKGLHDLEIWLKSKLAILRRQAKRQPTPESKQKLHDFVRDYHEVRAARFDAVARRCAMPRGSWRKP